MFKSWQRSERKHIEKERKFREIKLSIYLFIYLCIYSSVYKTIFKGTVDVISRDPPSLDRWTTHYRFIRSKYFHLLIAPIEGFITLIG